MNFSSQFFHSLFGNQCVLCRIRMNYRGSVCSYCLGEVHTQVLKKRVLIHCIDDLKVYSLFRYESKVKDLVLDLKKKPALEILEPLAERIRDIISARDLSSCPIVWVPGYSFEDLHLVEALMNSPALRTLQSGTPFLRRNISKTKSQKSLNRLERKQSHSQYTFGKTKSLRVVLFDDVCTSGQTLLRIRDDLKKQNVEVVCAITLAYTPLHFS